MKLKTKLRRKFKKNFGAILIIGMITLIGIAANINLLLAEAPVIKEPVIHEKRFYLFPEAKNEPISVEAEIRAIARETGFKWPDYLVRLAFYESSYNPNAVNINKDGSRDRGIFQWNEAFHPEVDDDCAFNVRCATLKAMEAINAGNQHWWAANELAKRK